MYNAIGRRAGASCQRMYITELAAVTVTSLHLFSMVDRRIRISTLLSLIATRSLTDLYLKSISPSPTNPDNPLGITRAFGVQSNIMLEDNKLAGDLIHHMHS